MGDWSSIGKNIRRCRKQKGITQEVLSEIADISPNYLGNIERGEKTPSLETLVAILNGLGVSADVILHDVVEADYDVTVSLLNEKLNKLSPKDRARIFDVVETEIRHSLQVKP